MRRLIGRWQEKCDPQKAKPKAQTAFQPQGTYLPIPLQLHLLGLAPFQGRQHCGIDDARNVSRIVVELARRGMRLRPNTPINPNRRWPWMGRSGSGKVLEDRIVLPPYSYYQYTPSSLQPSPTKPVSRPPPALSHPRQTVIAATL